ncbi:hypothetical protein [Iodobacter fluviatilis]|jgi:hypothetical protein|uniref:Uncharacterized protein n=1 Tax=Iodobacter fluviatilis TaxID=537 RepID=A0A7G3G440_9NEIS|nr:hypothetical protein [Iodobacter fluviatilis]QBC42150.1 hypothetical protein C1H71_00305 [Iodobacter fluviatilis]
MHPAIINASKLILVGNISGAEKALSDIADEHGDHALSVILEDVAPKDLLAILREYDSAKETVLSLVVSPEQFARAVVLDKLYGERNKDKLRGMMNAVIYKHADTAPDYLEAIFEQKGGAGILADYFEGHYEVALNFILRAHLETTPLPFLDDENILDPEEISAFFEVFYSSENIMDKVDWGYSRTELADNDWKETLWILFHEVPDAFDHLIDEVQSRMLAACQRAAQKTEINPEALDKLLQAICNSSNDDIEESAI